MQPYNIYFRATFSPQVEQSLREKVKKILDAHVCEPSLVHGDLWSGNQAYTKGNPDGEPVIFDPAVYVRVYLSIVSFLYRVIILPLYVRYVCMYVCSTATARWTLPWLICLGPTRPASTPGTTSAGHLPPPLQRASSCARRSTTSTTFLTTSSCSAEDISPKPRWWWALFSKHPYDKTYCIYLFYS